MIFEKIKTIPTSKEVLDKAFRRAKRAFSGKKITNLQSKIESYESMILTASNIISDNLGTIVKAFPNFDLLHLYYKEMSNLLVNLNNLKKSLSHIDWASKKIHELSRAYIPKIRKSKEPNIIQKQIFGRISSIMDTISLDLLYLNESRNKLINIPDINTETKSIIVSGYPNVGKSSFVSLITNANLKIASYPFTTTSINIGHLYIGNELYQVIDTPGLLDRPMNARNNIELQSIIALKYLKAVILVFIDATESCGYSITEQMNLVCDIKKYFNMSFILVVSNKSDLFNSCDIIDSKQIDCFISTKTSAGILDLLNKIQEHKNQL